MELAIIDNLQTNMRAKEISIRDAGGAISISFGNSVLLLNKPQISIIEIIKDDTVRIEMGSNNTNSLFIKATDVVDPVIRDANELRDAIQAMLPATAGGGDGDCACAPLIKDTNKGLQDVVTAVNTGNLKADATAQTIAGIYDNGLALNQISADNNVAIGVKLDATTAAVIDTHARLDGINLAVNNANQSQLQQLSSMAQTLTQIRSSLTGNASYQEPLRIDDTAPLITYKGYSAITNLDQNSSGTPVWAIEKIVRNGDSYTYLWANGSKSMTNVWLNRANINYLPLAAS